MAAVLRRPHLVESTLTARESQVLRLVAAGMTTKEIAAALSIAESTVNWHVGNALARLGASSRAEAVAIMMREGPAEVPVLFVRPQQRPRLAWPLVAVLALSLALAVAGSTGLAAWYLGTHSAPPSYEAPSLAPAPTTAPTTGGTQPTASASAGAGTPATNETPHALVVPPGPVMTTVPAVPITTPPLPVASAPAVPSVPSLTPAPTRLPLPPLATPSLPGLAPR